MNVFEPKFSIFAKQQYPSFSTSLQRSVTTWGLWYANTFVDFFSHTNDQHFSTFCFRLIQYVPLVFSGNITFKTNCCYNASSFFRPDFHWVDFFSHDHCERTKNLLLILLIRLKKANISVDMLYDEKDADFVFFIVLLLICFTISSF